MINSNKFSFDSSFDSSLESSSDDYSLESSSGPSSEMLASSEKQTPITVDILES